MREIMCPLCNVRIDPVSMKCTNCKRGMRDIQSAMGDVAKLNTLAKSQQQAQDQAAYRAEAEAKRLEGIREGAAASESQRLAAVRREEQEETQRHVRQQVVYEKRQAVQKESNGFTLMMVIGMGLVGAMVGVFIPFMTMKASELGASVFILPVLIGTVVGAGIGLVIGLSNT